MPRDRLAHQELLNRAADQLRPIDAPFGQPFSEWLETRVPIGPQYQKPIAQLPRLRPLQPGDYHARRTFIGQAHHVYLLTKNHCGPWHEPTDILAACDVDHPLGYRDFCDIGGGQATVIIHTD